MQRFWLQLALVALIVLIITACSGGWGVNLYDDDYRYYSDCPRHYTYGPMNCDVCHW